MDRPQPHLRFSSARSGARPREAPRASSVRARRSLAAPAPANTARAIQTSVVHRVLASWTDGRFTKQANRQCSSVIRPEHDRVSFEETEFPRGQGDLRTNAQSRGRSKWHSAWTHPRGRRIQKEAFMVVEGE